MKSTCLMMAVAGLLLLAADAPDDVAKKDLAKFKGRWNVESRLQSGKEAKEGDETVTFDGDKIVIKIGNHQERGTFKIDRSKTPSTIDMISADGKNILLGIYQFDGNALKIAFNKDDAGRPGELTSKPDSGVMLIEMKMQAADAAATARKDLDNLQGTWNVESGQFDGKELTEDKFPIQMIAIKGDAGTLKVTSDASHQCVIELDAGKKPPIIRLLDMDDKTLVHGEAIYKLDGDTLKLALFIAKMGVPMELASKPGSGAFFLVLKRETK